MMRVIVTPAVLPPTALAELKDWLGISTTADDAGLMALLATAVEVCADFIGMMPLLSTFEESLALSCRPASGWYAVATRPVRAVLGLDLVGADGRRNALPAVAYQVVLDGDGTCRIHLSPHAPALRAALRFTAGLAEEWPGLPEALRHGILRLAAHYYRSRDAGEAGLSPPASVSALWRPWRRLRLA